MMNKNGFTLIETVISIFILTILFSVGLSLNKFATNLSTDVNDVGYVYEIQNLLSYGKAICFEKNKYGKISVKVNTNEIRFVEGWDNIEKVVKLPKGIQINSNKDINIKITPDGKISQGATINLIDCQGKQQEITIVVGVDLIVIKDGEFI